MLRRPYHNQIFNVLELFIIQYKDMINYTPIQSRKSSDTFQLNRGLDTVNNANFLDKGKIVKALNIYYTDNGWTRRQGLSII